MSHKRSRRDLEQELKEIKQQEFLLQQKRELVQREINLESSNLKLMLQNIVTFIDSSEEPWLVMSDTPSEMMNEYFYSLPKQHLHKGNHCGGCSNTLTLSYKLI